MNDNRIINVTPQGQVYLCKTPLENDYKNQLTFESKQKQLDYFNTTIKKTFNNYTYIRHDNAIKVNANIDEIIDCNYLFYRNTGFTNKYYFCFISDMVYVSEDVTLIVFETDVFQTWQFDIDYKPCFVEREHVNDDTIGLNLIDEGLELGEITYSSSENFGIGNCHAVIILSEDIFRGSTNYPYQEINGIPSGLHYYVVGDFTSINFIAFCTEYSVTESKPNLIQGIFMAPDTLTGYQSSTSSDYWSFALNDGGFNYAPYHKINDSNSSVIMQNYSSSKKYDNINGYVPKNNKLFTYPYNYCIVDNNSGSVFPYRYEDFTNNVTFKIYGNITAGCSIRAIPTNFKNINENNSHGINAGKLPIGSYNVDMWKNYLTQNGLNIANFINNKLVRNVATNMGTVITQVGGIINQIPGLSLITNNLLEINQARLTPDEVAGNTNSSDVTYSSGKLTFTLYKASIKQQFARNIDDFFNMFGYKVNVTKIPNITGRTNWNFVKTIECNFNGNIPPTSIRIIRRIFDTGITLWHNPNTIYDYSQNNNIE